MERTPSPVHIPVVATGDDNTRLAVDEAGVVIGDRSGPLIAEDAPLRVPAASPRRCGRDGRYRAPLECFGVKELAARAGCIKGLATSPDRP